MLSMAASESLLCVREIVCVRCGWSWIMFTGETEADCPFCPSEPWGIVFIAP